jgi:transposase
MELTVISIEEKYEMKDMYRKGISISEIARQTGHDRKTVRRAIQTGLAPAGAKPVRRKRRERKLDAYVPYLQQRMAEGVYNTRKLHQELKARGYSGGLTQVILYVQPYRPAQQEKAVMRFETEPGHQAQVDWGSFGYIAQDGRRRQLYGFVMTLGWSRAMYVEFTTSANTDWFIRCHQHAFEYFGGVPREMLHDNLKSAVLYRDSRGEIHWNERYVDFAGQMGFTPRPCKPYRAQTKGKVERSIRYIRQNFWPGLHYTDLHDLNEQALRWLNEVANTRLHGTTQVTPFSRLNAEQLQALPAQRFETSLTAQRVASRDCLVSYKGNLYSVPAAYAQQVLLVKETEDNHIVLVDALGEIVAVHRILAGRAQRAIVAAHYAGLPMATQQTQTSVARQMPVLPPRLDTPQVETRSLNVYALLLEVDDD